MRRVAAPYLPFFPSLSISSTPYDAPVFYTYHYIQLAELTRESQELREVLAKSEKERHALRTIMEDKMKLIVGEMAGAVGELRLDPEGKLVKQVRFICTDLLYCTPFYTLLKRGKD
jgi:hypothetical protein